MALEERHHGEDAQRFWRRPAFKQRLDRRVEGFRLAAEGELFKVPYFSKNISYQNIYNRYTNKNTFQVLAHSLERPVGYVAPEIAGTHLDSGVDKRNGGGKNGGLFLRTSRRSQELPVVSGKQTPVGGEAMPHFVPEVLDIEDLILQEAPGKRFQAKLGKDEAVEEDRKKMPFLFRSSRDNGIFLRSSLLPE